MAISSWLANACAISFAVAFATLAKNVKRKVTLYIENAAKLIVKR